MAGSDGSGMRFEVTYWRDGRAWGKAYRTDSAAGALELVEKVLGVAGPWERGPLAPVDTVRVDAWPMVGVPLLEPERLDLDDPAASNGRVVLESLAAAGGARGLRAGDWCAASGVARPTFWRWYKRLADAGLVERKRLRRAVWVHVTDEGRAVLDGLVQP